MKAKDRDLPLEANSSLPQKEVAGDIINRLNKGGLKKVTTKEVLFLSLISINQNLHQITANLNQITEDVRSITKGFKKITIMLLVLVATYIIILLIFAALKIFGLI